MQVHDQLALMDAQHLREFAASLIETLASKDHELRYKELKIEQLTHEMAVLKRWKFAARSEQLQALVIGLPWCRIGAQATIRVA
jgi:hypothetical protein